MTSVAVIIPAHQEADGIVDAVLFSAAREVGRKNVYLTTDGSTDSTGSMARYWLPKDNVEASGVNRGKAHALRHLIESRRLTERYDYIYQLDADTVPSEGHIRALLDRVDPGVAVAVGRLESNYELNRTVYGRYRAFMYSAYNWVIRAPQDLMRVVNVLPGSSVMFRSDVLDAMDWEAVGKYRLDDYRQLYEVRLKKLGAVRYYANTPPAYILEPYTFADYSKQFKRWMYGIGEIMRGERIWRHWRKPAFAWDMLHMGGWVLSFLALPVGLWAAITFLNTGAWWLIPALLLVGLAQNTLLVAVYVLQTGRIASIAYLPVFFLFSLYEAFVATRGMLGLYRTENETGAWNSPARNGG